MGSWEPRNPYQQGHWIKLPNWQFGEERKIDIKNGKVKSHQPAPILNQLLVRLSRSRECRIRDVLTMPHLNLIFLNVGYNQSPKLMSCLSFFSSNGTLKTEVWFGMPCFSANVYDFVILVNKYSVPSLNLLLKRSKITNHL